MDLCAFGRSYWKYTSFYDSNCEISFYLHLAFLLQSWFWFGCRLSQSEKRSEVRGLNPLDLNSLVLLQSELILDRACNKMFPHRRSRFEPWYKEKYTNKFTIWVSLSSNQGSMDKNRSGIRTLVLPSRGGLPWIRTNEVYIISKWSSTDTSADPWSKINKNNFHLGRIFLIIIKGNEDNASSLLSSHSIGLDWCPRLHIF